MSSSVALPHKDQWESYYSVMTDIHEIDIDKTLGIQSLLLYLHSWRSTCAYRVPRGPAACDQ